MLYGFGSITKTFVAAIVLQLVEENRLGLEDRLEKWLFPLLLSKALQKLRYPLILTFPLILQ